MPIRLGVGTRAREFHHVVGDRLDEHAGIVAEDQIDQDHRQDRQESEFDEQPEKPSGPFEKSIMRAPRKPCGWGAAGSPPRLDSPQSKRVSGNRVPSSVTPPTRFENSQRMKPSAIKPTRPFAPRSLTKAMMLAATLPKNGMFCAADQQGADDAQRQQHQAEISQRTNPRLHSLNGVHERFPLFAIAELSTRRFTIRSGESTKYGAANAR